MTHVERKAATLEEVEWSLLTGTFADTIHCVAVGLLREKSNLPLTAYRLFRRANHDLRQMHINTKLREKKLPYRLVRIGPRLDKQSRASRRLAFVRWPNAEQLQLPLESKTRYGNRP